MGERNEIHVVFSDFGKRVGAKVQSRSWVLRGSEADVIISLQKSRFSGQYYANIGIWFLKFGERKSARTSDCHIQTRVDQLFDLVERAEFERLMNFDAPIPDEVRYDRLLEFLDRLDPILRISIVVSGLCSDIGMRLTSSSLIDGDGQRFLREVCG